MKYLCLAICVFVSSLQLSYGQEFDFIDSPPDTFFLDASTTVDVTVFFDIKNNSPDTLEILAERLENSMASGHSSFFCWDICYDTTVEVSEFPISLLPGDTTRFQYITFVTGGVNGRSSVKMKFSATDSNLAPIERSYFFQVSGATATSSTKKVETKTAKIYPLPARDFINIFYPIEENAQPLDLLIVNTKGQRIVSRKLTTIPESHRLSTAGIPPGMYFLRIFEGEQLVISSKIVITD